MPKEQGKEKSETEKLFQKIDWPCLFREEEAGGFMKIVPIVCLVLQIVILGILIFKK